MKNSLLSFIAWTMGMAYVIVRYQFASTSPATRYFEFDNAHYAPTLFNVQDESKWIPVSNIGACSNERIKACRIEVSKEYARGNILLPTAAITAQEYSRDTTFVTGGFLIRFINKR